MSVIIKTEPGETEATTVLPDPGCGGKPIMEQDFLMKEEEEEHNITNNEVGKAKCLFA